MKRNILFLLLVLVVTGTQTKASKVIIPIETSQFTLLLEADNQHRLRTVYFGDKLQNKNEYPLVSSESDYTDSNIGICNAAYPTSGTYSLNVPAIQVQHADGNTSLELLYQSHTSEMIENGAARLTTIVLNDPVYNIEVKLFYKSFLKENTIEQWTEIANKNKKTIRLHKYSSANLYFSQEDAHLTTFHNQWAKEMQMNTQALSRGIKTIESRLGSRALLLQSPSFILSFGDEPKENEGLTVLGHLAWSGNFKIDFEIDSYDNLRLLAGIHPHASEIALEKNQTFKTPSFIYSVSNNGTGEASRNLHNWARNYRVLDGKGERLTLLNNWEATYFDFDEKKIASLFSDAQDLGVDLFLLDDGWFGNKHPRNGDNAGLGDWKENAKKLPNGIGYLVEEAHKENIKFGIWIEPEMVNPKSELYEQHSDWVIRQPERPEIYFRNQLVLDLANPEVQDFVYDVVDNLFTENPELAFIKWDCNSVIFNAHSAYLAKTKQPQTHLYTKYVHGLYTVLEKLRAKYPTVPMMLCSGGGGRADYGLLKYFTEFWPSDDTDPLERVYIQWNYSYFFPSIVTDNHVTNWGDQPIKYKVDVASMGKLGFDIVAEELEPNELTFCKEAVQNYHNFKHVVWHGDQYRLQSPYENDVASLLYTTPEKDRIIVFSYLVNHRVTYHTATEPIVLNGLDKNKRYKVKELNVMPGVQSKIDSEKTYTGDFLMKVGIRIPVTQKYPSVVLEITEE